MSDLKQEEDASGGRFFIDAPEGEAEITYRFERGVMVIDHTFVPPALRGGDHAMRLVRRAVDEAGSRGLKVVPECSYVARVFDFMPEWAALRAS
jgi:hypothetical protein